MKRASNLKEMFIVRYADDFKIFGRNHNTAQKVLIAIKQWLKERLNLKISPEKSIVVNLRYKIILNLDEIGLERLNKLRSKVRNCII